MKVGVLTAGVLLALCLAPGVARAQLFEKTDTKTEVELGRAGGREMEAQIPPSKNRAMHERVRRIGQALVAALPEKAYPYEFKVLASPEFNAVCFPGGIMYVFEGLLNRLPDDDAVAYVMGHEITHASHRHWANQTRKTSRDFVLGLAFNVLTRTNAGTDTAALLSYSYSRGDESDADRTGMELMWAAGYDPEKALAAPRVMAELEKASGGGTPPYLRTHPHPKDRIKNLTELAARLKQRPRPTRDGTAGASTANVTAAVTALTGALPAVTSAPNPYFPLVVGAEWTYQVSGGSGGTSHYTVRIPGALPRTTGNDSSESAPRPDGGISVFRGVTVLGRGTEVPFQIFTTASEVWRRNRPMASDSAWRVDHLLDLEEGSPIERDSVTFTRLPAETVSTPSGVFPDARKVRRKNAKFTVDLWYVPGVGLVKTYCAETGITETLQSYKVPTIAKDAPP